jgi:hypothetical protein
MPLNPRRVQAIFSEAAARHDPAGRAAILDCECSADQELRQRVGALLTAHDEINRIADEPVDVTANPVQTKPPPGIGCGLNLMTSVLDPTELTSRTLHSIALPKVSVVASSVSEGWDGVQALFVDGELTDWYRTSSPLHLAVFLLGGTTRVEWKREGRFRRFVSEPGSVTIIPAEGDHQFRTEGPAQALVWMIDPARLQSIAEQEWGPGGPRVRILEACNSRDAEFWTLGQRLAARLLSPIPGSRLCAEALVIELTLHLLWNYSSLPRGKALENSTGGSRRSGETSDRPRSQPRDNDHGDSPGALLEANNDGSSGRPVALAGHGLTS